MVNAVHSVATGGGAVNSSAAGMNTSLVTASCAYQGIPEYSVEQPKLRTACVLARWVL